MPVQQPPSAPSGRSEDERTILSMFAYMRPAGSVTEQAFVDRFLTPLGFVRDPYQNLILHVGDTPPTILWSSHMDTVHRREGTQTLHYDGHILALSRKARALGSNCLGADDTAGIWLMTEMVKAGVPGLYVIHHAEEEGCVGSRALAAALEASDEPLSIATAIAFDRKGFRSIVTHQSGAKTASDAFAKSLADALGGTFDPDDTGVYTDTDSYSDLIPECTNISVGYMDQHTAKETQDVRFLIDLRDKLITADFTSLIIEREPGDDGWFDRRSSHTSFAGSSSSFIFSGLEDYVRAYPEVATQILEAFGITDGTFRSSLEDAYGDYGQYEDEDDGDDDDNHQEPSRGRLTARAA